MAGTAWYQGKYSIIEGEAKALLEAMRTMEQNGFSHVIFETDSKNVVDAIHNLRLGISEFSSIICNIRNVLSLNQNFVVKFVKRQANMVAHNLARAAIVWASRYVVDVLPLYITPLVNNEMI
jgi:ribonuclease HI